MPGQGCSVLGSSLAAAGVASVVALAVASTVSRLALLRPEWSPRTAAVRVAAIYTVLTLGLWAVVRAVFYPVAFSQAVDALAAWVAIGGVGSAVLSGGTTYAYARFRYLSALLGLFVVTAFTWYAFLHVGGETGVLSIWGFVFAPVFAVATVVLLAGEWLLRRLIDGENGENGAAT